MNIGRGRVTALAAALVVTIAGCTSDPAGSPAPTSESSAGSTRTSTKGPTPEESAERAALDAYDGFWTAQNAAKAAPGARDWTADISEFAADPARVEALNSIQNYASIPAHFEGEPERAPTVKSVSLAQPPRVIITDCLDVTEVKIVHDKTGENVGDTANQPPRYRLEAEVVLYTNLTPQKWLVQITRPMLEQSC